MAFARTHGNKLSRTYAVLLDALNRYRGKGQQKVTVEHVHVHSGGQAVVGMVESPEGVSPPNPEEQPHAICLCPGHRNAEPELGAVNRAKRQRCGTVAAGCTAEPR
jgi:hypothetical protein